MERQRGGQAGVQFVFGLRRESTDTGREIVRRSRPTKRTESRVVPLRSLGPTHRMSDKPQNVATRSGEDPSDFAHKTLQDYEVLAVMGNGSFGTCYKVRDKSTGELFAWKGMNYDELDDDKCDSLVSEISMLRQLQHPNIVQYYHHLVNREAKSIYIVMECCAGGDLSQLIQRARAQRQRFEERYIWRVLFQLCRALQVCHNKIPNGTILHRDIKPANIFLDAAGNAKLGDFGLARMLRRDQSFAASFVGTPHYMSPELVKGRQYDRKSDVWAVGCLVYEMCALRPPFRGRAFDQLSEKIAQGEFSRIPGVYSSDLQEIIAFMLAVDHEQRPGIEVIIRHPLVVRNISELDGEFPTLVEAGEDFNMPGMGRLFEDLPELSSTMFTEQYSFNEDYGQRRLSVTGVFTPDLRSELFYSAKRRIFPTNKVQQSDPALYESIRREEQVADQPQKRLEEGQGQSPRLLTQNIFDDVLQTRLHAIRAQESLMQQKLLELQARENQLQLTEKRVQALQRELLEKLDQQPPTATCCKCSQTDTAMAAPPIPPRRPHTKVHHDDTYCTIELNETSPTVAKLNLAALPAPKSLQSHANTLRKVTFQSPQKFVTYGIENVPPPSSAVPVPVPATTVQPMQMSVSSNDSGDSQASSTRRKSILALFGLSRGSKSVPKPVAVAPPAQLQAQPPANNRFRPPLALKPPAAQQPAGPGPAPAPSAPLANLWTKEQKKQAFELLAAMNAAEKDAAGGSSVAGAGGRRQHLRQSVRERNSTMQRNRMRRSLVVAGGGPQKLSSREQMLI
ncbi:serine/threonine-protein kinase Nek11 [Drosophila pseudoobscura]|uniref:non-specific serine/threonine protein kinase n=1 Tax=Drosophila pseudoobscura pseudoobscura TaxID=46245 RepID=A0A6I8UGP4_DROPS|nr:serine/threonine-protein kinase Nek11 [Drosophila pseudoobscura]